MIVHKAIGKARMEFKIRRRFNVADFKNMLSGLYQIRKYDKVNCILNPSIIRPAAIQYKQPMYTTSAVGFISFCALILFSHLFYMFHELLPFYLIESNLE